MTTHFPVFGPAAYQLDAQALYAVAQTHPEETAEELHGFASDLATIKNLPVATSDDVPERERHAQKTLHDLIAELGGGAE